MTDAHRITFMQREEQNRCSLCNTIASLAQTSEGLLCATCVLLFLRKPPTPLEQKERTDVDIMTRDLRSMTAALHSHHPAA